MSKSKAVKRIIADKSEFRLDTPQLKALSMIKEDGLWYVVQIEINKGLVTHYHKSHGDTKAIALEELKTKSVNTFWRDTE